MILTGFTLLVISSLFLINGPYVRDGIYAKGGIVASFWGLRPLKEEHLADLDIKF